MDRVSGVRPNSLPSLLRLCLLLLAGGERSVMRSSNSNAYDFSSEKRAESNFCTKHGNYSLLLFVCVMHAYEEGNLSIV